MRKKIIFVCIFVLMFKLSFANLKDETEEIYLQIRAEKLVNDFFLVRYNYEKEKMYIGLNTLFYFLELYNLKIDVKNLSIDGKIGSVKTKVHFTETESFVVEDELFVDVEAIKKKLNFDYINYDLSMLSLEVKTGFLLPYQEKENGKIERIRLDENKIKNNKEKYDYKMQKKFIDSGLLKLNYSKFDIEKSESYLAYEYGTQFLWGELYLSGDIAPTAKLKTRQLTYSDIYMGNNLIIGNINPILPSFVNLDSNLIGVSFDDYTTYSQSNNGETVIKGEAEGADSIELYRNGILVEYLLPTTKDFEFRIADNITSSRYLLKIYYKDGRIEERTVYSLNDMDALKKGTHKPVIQVAQTEKEKNMQVVLKEFYGVTDNLTLGVGYLDLKTNKDKNYSILQNNIIYNTRVPSFPTLINFVNYYEIKEKQDSFEWKIEQRIYDYGINIQQEKYSKYFYEDSGTKEYQAISFDKNFKLNSFEVGLNKRISMLESLKTQKLIELKTTNIYAGWYTSIFNPFSFSFNIEKTISGKDKYIKYSPGLSLNKWVTVILNADFTKYKENKDNDTIKYSLEINKRNIELIKENLYLDIGFIVEQRKKRGEKKETSYGLTFNVDLEGMFDMKLNSNTKKSENKKSVTTTGVDINKVIDISSPLRTYKNTIPVNSYLIKGKVFLDRNGNGIYDNLDTPLEGVNVVLEGRKFISNKKGEYVADGIGSGNIVTLDVDRKSMDPMMKPVKTPIKIKTNNSSVLNIDIPVEVVSMITGNIWNASNFTEREFIQNISMTSIRLEKDGKLYKEIDPEFDGLYFFEDIPPGEYNMKFLYVGEESIEFSPTEIPIKIKLTNPEEGEYFEANDTMMKLIKIKDENKKVETSDNKSIEIKEKVDNVEENIEDIINNY